MFDSIFETTMSNTLEISATNAIICIVVAILLGFAISLLYVFGDKSKRTSANFALTLVLLPAIVAIVIMLIGSNIARAISLGGVFALVRFRSVPGDSKDISSIFFAMTVGLAAGMGYPLFAFIITAIIGAVYFVLSFAGYAMGREMVKVLRVNIPENLNFDGAFDDLFEQYTKDVKLTKIKTTNLGSLYELTYEIIFKRDVSHKEFIDKLRCRNGNLNITLSNLDMQENVL